MKTCAGRPARAAYAAMAPPALPADGIASVRAPSSSARDTATACPRLPGRLERPGGFQPVVLEHARGAAEPRAGPRRRQQWRHPLAEGDDVARLAHREQLAVPPQ